MFPRNYLNESVGCNVSNELNWWGPVNWKSFSHYFDDQILSRLTTNKRESDGDGPCFIGANIKRTENKQLSKIPYMDYIGTRENIIRFVTSTNNRLPFTTQDNFYRFSAIHEYFQ